MMMDDQVILGKEIGRNKVSLVSSGVFPHVPSLALLVNVFQRDG